MMETGGAMRKNFSILKGKCVELIGLLFYNIKMYNFFMDGKKYG